MHRPTRLKITDVNPHLICILCGGYLIDATTMVECLHSYCRACIVAYLRQSRQCPICDTVVHKTRPLLNIRSDKTLQNLVYKLVPNLFKDEMKRRREFYAKHPQASTSMQSPNAREERGEVCDDSLVIYTDDEYISLSLDYYFPQPRKETTPPPPSPPSPPKANGEGSLSNKRPNGDKNGLPGDVVEKRYLRCPAAVCISHIKKFIRNKFGLSSAHRIEVVHHNGEDEPLRNDYTLMDIAYIYTWRRNGPLPLLFRVFEPVSKRRKRSHSRTSSSSDSIPLKEAGDKQISQTTPQPQDSASKTSTPLSPVEKRHNIPKSPDKIQTSIENVKVPSKPTNTSSDISKPSIKGPSHDDMGATSQKMIMVEKMKNVVSNEKPSKSSTITLSSPTHTSRKTIIIVTSAKTVPTSSVTEMSVSKTGLKTTESVNTVTMTAKSTTVTAKTDVGSSIPNTTSNINTTSSAPSNNMTLSSTALAPPTLKEILGGAKTPVISNKVTVAISKTATIQTERTEPQGNKYSAPSVEKGVGTTPQTTETSQPPLSTVTAQDQNKNTTPTKTSTPPAKNDTTPEKNDTTPTKIETTPTDIVTKPSMTNTTQEEPMDVSVCDGIVIDRPVLLT